MTSNGLVAMDNVPDSFLHQGASRSRRPIRISFGFSGSGVFFSLNFSQRCNHFLFQIGRSFRIVPIPRLDRKSTRLTSSH